MLAWPRRAQRGHSAAGHFCRPRQKCVSKGICGWPISRILFRAYCPLMTIHLRALLPMCSSSQPGSLGGSTRARTLARPLFGFAPGGACRALKVTPEAVGSYLTVSPLPALRLAVYFLWRYPSGYPGRPLTGAMPSWSPDFPRFRAVIQPSAGVF